MLRRIILENFMSHGRTVIELADGLTVLTGPNNCGKSAVVAALQTVATNNSGRSTHVMRHGEKVCRITIETDEGHVICWERKKTTVKYTLNGEDIHRVRSSVPDGLGELLRLDQIDAEAGNKKFDIHFGEQKSPVFLLNESSGQAGSFFASSSDASRLIEMQHRHRTQLADKKKEAKRLAAESEINVARLDTFKPITRIEQRIEQAELADEELKTQQTRIQRLKELVGFLDCESRSCRRLRSQCTQLARLDQAVITPTELERVAGAVDRGRSLVARINDLQRQIIKLRWQSKTLASLAEPPRLEPANACRQLEQRLRATIDAVEGAQRFCDRLSRLQSPPPIGDTLPLRRLISKLNKTHQLNRALRSQMSVLLKIDKPPEEFPTDRVRQIMNAIKLQQSVSTKAAASVRCLMRVSVPVERIDNSALKSKIEGVKKWQQTVMDARQTANMANEQLLECKQKIRRFVASNPKCTACGGNIDPETLMSSVPDLHDHS